jgi:hypothetical protein
VSGTGPDLAHFREPLFRDREERLARAFFFVCPAWRRCLFTVRAAISFARRVEPPRFFTDALTCSYCRFRFGLFTPLGGIARSFPPGAAM